MSGRQGSWVAIFLLAVGMAVFIGPLPFLALEVISSQSGLWYFAVGILTIQSAAILGSWSVQMIEEDKRAAAIEDGVIKRKAASKNESCRHGCHDRQDS